MSSGPRRAKTLAMLTASAAIVVIAVVLMLGVAVWSLFLAPETTRNAGVPVQIRVNEGSSTAQIANSLAKAGVVRNANAFRLRARVAGADGSLRPGVYDLVSGMSASRVLDTLLSGPRVEYVSVTVPEGFVVEQIAERLSREAGIPEAEFLRLARKGAPEFAEKHPYLADAYGGSLEGYLFPKTYRIRAGASSSDVIEMMLRQFDREVAVIDTGDATRRGLSFSQFVVLASMIERESKLDRERPLVASVIYNRLAAGMLLEIDATIEYVLPGNRFRLRNSDLRIESPYNTYRHTGLPPGAISNPGLAALKAAANPADTDNIYYVLTGKEGSHTFADNKADFLLAKKKSKEVFGR